MKQQKVKYQTVTHTVSQKIFGALALAALFVCGIMVGVGLNRTHAETKLSSVQSSMPEKVEAKETCTVIEEIQLKYLRDEKSWALSDHQENIRVYETLFQHGCDENKSKYRDAIAREMEILAALNGQNNSTCEQIESLLLDQLPPASGDSEDRIARAKIYANLSERGCSENSQKYVDLAKQELEIARALQDDEFDKEDTIEVVETYKRLNMQAAAEEIFETAKKLTNPAIDFILEVEKIINEQ